MDDGRDERGPFRYCPQCRSEYRMGFRVCSDCGADLVDELPPAAPESSFPTGDLEALQSVVGTDPVAVLTTGSELQAALVRGLLIDAGIPAAVWASGFGGYFGHASTGAGFGTRVMVHKEDEAEARALIAAADETPGR